MIARGELVSLVGERRRQSGVDDDDDDDTVQSLSGTGNLDGNTSVSAGSSDSGSCGLQLGAGECKTYSQQVDVSKCTGNDLQNFSEERMARQPFGQYVPLSRSTLFGVKLWL